MKNTILFKNFISNKCFVFYKRRVINEIILYPKTLILKVTFKNKS